MNDFDITIIGAGLAGCEASWRLAEAGLRVRLCEQKPAERTPAQISPHFAELVCSNSFRSRNPANAVGLLKEEMAALGSLTMAVAETCRVPAGDALAVDRVAFAKAISARMQGHPNIAVVGGRIDELPPASAGDCILATGPLTADALAQSLARATGQAGLYFYDALAPIIAADTVDGSIAFAASRWDKGEGSDYLNCPLNQDEYERLIDFLLSADTYPAHAFEEPKYFPGCQPIEVIAQSGRDALRFGPLKPVGLTDPRTGRWPHAVVQLRKEDRQGQAYNLVGLQTKLRQGPQKELMNLIPGLAGAQILRYGALHRNTYVDGPTHLDDHFRLRTTPHVRLAGQITGVEGYVESAATGMLVAMLWLQHRSRASGAIEAAGQPPPATCAMGALYHHVRGTARLPGRPHEPQNVHWGLFSAPEQEPLAVRKNKALRKELRLQRARESFAAWLALPTTSPGPTAAASSANSASLSPSVTPKTPAPTVPLAEQAPAA